MATDDAITTALSGLAEAISERGMVSVQIADLRVAITRVEGYAKSIAEKQTQQAIHADKTEIRVNSLEARQDRQTGFLWALLLVGPIVTSVVTAGLIKVFVSGLGG